MGDGRVDTQRTSHTSGVPVEESRGGASVLGRAGRGKPTESCVLFPALIRQLSGPGRYLSESYPFPIRP